MNDVTALEKADQYVRWVKSNHEFEISEHIQTIAKKWIKANQLLMQYPKEQDALRHYCKEENVPESTARRDFSIAQYIYGKAQLPNRSYQIKLQIDRADKLLDYALNISKADPIEIGKLVAKALELKNKIIAMLPEEVEPPDMEKYKRRNCFSMDVGFVGKTPKDMEEMLRLYERIKAKSSPKMNFDGIAEDTEPLRS